MESYVYGSVLMDDAVLGIASTTKQCTGSEQHVPHEHVSTQKREREAIRVGYQTRSPGLVAVTSSPTASTTPAISSPSTVDSPGGGG